MTEQYSASLLEPGEVVDETPQALRKSKCHSARGGVPRFEYNRESTDGSDNLIFNYADGSLEMLKEKGMDLQQQSGARRKKAVSENDFVNECADSKSGKETEKEPLQNTATGEDKLRSENDELRRKLHAADLKIIQASTTSKKLKHKVDELEAKDRINTVLLNEANKAARMNYDALVDAEKVVRYDRRARAEAQAAHTAACAERDEAKAEAAAAAASATTATTTTTGTTGIRLQLNTGRSQPRVGLAITPPPEPAPIQPAPAPPRGYLRIKPSAETTARIQKLEKKKKRLRSQLEDQARVHKTEIRNAETKTAYYRGGLEKEKSKNRTLQHKALNAHHVAEKVAMDRVRAKIAKGELVL